MQVKITSPDTILFDGQAMSVHLPGVGGSFQILENHAPIVSALTRGTIRLTDDDGKQLSFDIRGGVIKCQQNIITILAQ